jgi:energy-coupling factor transporter ATP-binding protein EcfA2
LLRHSVKDISTGQRKLVAIASILHKNRQIRLFDEPTANLDPQAAEKVLTLIKQSATNCITIIASHDENVGSISTCLLHTESKNGQWVFNSVNDKHEKDKSLGPIRFNKNTFSEQEIIFNGTNITYRYPNGELGLKPLSLSIYRGDCLAISGNTGKGKTTLIKILTKEIKPTSGQVLISKLGKCSVVFQENERQLFSDTVLGELLLGLPHKRDIINEAEAILEKINLSNRAEIPPFFLSSGEKKKLLIASILLHHPTTLILDEPFAGMDAISVEKIVSLLREYRESNLMTVLIVEHQPRLSSIFFSKYLEIK